MRSNYSNQSNQNISEKQHIKRTKQMTNALFNALENELNKKEQNEHILTLLQHAKIIEREE